MAVVKKQAVKDLELDYINNYGAEGKFLEYLLKKISNAVELENGMLVEFEKQDIKKSFCFGYGFCGVSTEEDSNNAYSMSEHARTSQEYFINENLEPINNSIKNYREVLENGDYMGVLCFKQTYGKKRCFLQTYRNSYELEDIKWRNSNNEFVGTLTVKDIENILDVLEEEKVKFIKRLNSYLKRYGLSKVRSWSYLVD